MIKKILITTLILIGLTNYSQDIPFTKPDYKKIQREINDEDSNLYYPKLMERLTKNDTLLTQEEYRHLYLGYVFQPKYNVFWKSTNEDKLEELYQKEKKEIADYDEIIKLCTYSLAEFPFHLSQLAALVHVYELKGDKKNYRLNSFKLHSILNAICSTGDGKECETGFHIIMPEHQSVLINIFQIEGNSQAIIGDCNYVGFEKGKYNFDRIYFNIEKILENESLY